MNSHAPIKDATALGIPKMLILGLQHLFAMFGATILVPILVNNYFEGQGLSIPRGIHPECGLLRGQRWSETPPRL